MTQFKMPLVQKAGPTAQKYWQSRNTENLNYCAFDKSFRHKRRTRELVVKQVTWQVHWFIVVMLTWNLEDLQGKMKFEWNTCSVKQNLFIFWINVVSKSLHSSSFSCGMRSGKLGLSRLWCIAFWKNHRYWKLNLVMYYQAFAPGTEDLHVSDSLM